MAAAVEEVFVVECVLPALELELEQTGLRGYLLHGAAGLPGRGEMSAYPVG